MTPEHVMTKTVEILRSGEYSQIRGRLKNTRGYCVTGIVALALGRRFISTGNYHWYELDGRNNTVSLAVKDKAVSGLLTRIPASKTKEYERNYNYNVHPDVSNRNDFLMHLNDNLKYSFDQIADVIEAEGWTT